MAENDPKDIVQRLLQANDGRLNIRRLWDEADLSGFDLRQAIDGLVQEQIVRVSDRMGKRQGVPDELAGIEFVTLVAEHRG